MKRAWLITGIALALTAGHGCGDDGSSGGGSATGDGTSTADGAAGGSGDGSGATTGADGSAGGPDAAGGGAGSHDAAGGDDDTAPNPDSGDAGDGPDAGPVVTACNAIAKTGCEEGQKCTYVSDTATAPACAPAGAVAPGGECASNGDCASGICLSISDTDSRCYTFCQTIGHCPDLGACLELESAPYKVCKISGLYDVCNLLLQNCPDGKGCYSIDGEDEPVCLPAGKVNLGQWCDSPSDCSPGTVCINHQCLQLCDKADPACGEFVACSNYVGSAGYCNAE